MAYEDLRKSGKHYALVAASTTVTLVAPGGSGAQGDYLGGFNIIPGTTSPGAVTYKDGTGSAITAFAGGTTSVAVLTPVFFPVMANSLSGAWSITTTSNVTVVAMGVFS
jgi:hypothetical protein